MSYLKYCVVPCNLDSMVAQGQSVTCRRTPSLGKSNNTVMEKATPSRASHEHLNVHERALLHPLLHSLLHDLQDLQLLVTFIVTLQYS